MKRIVKIKNKTERDKKNREFEQMWRDFNSGKIDKIRSIEIPAPVFEVIAVEEDD